MDVRESWLAIMAIKTPPAPKREGGTGLKKGQCGEEYHGIPIQHMGDGIHVNIRDHFAGQHVPSELMSGYK